MSSEKNLENSVMHLANRVADILESARSNVVQSVNYNTVTANWLIGREIVRTLQAGEERAELGKGLLKHSHNS